MGVVSSSGVVGIWVNSTGVISTVRCGPVQDIVPAPNAARNPVWRNALLLSFPLIVVASCTPKLASMKGNAWQPLYYIPQEKANPHISLKMDLRHSDFCFILCAIKIEAYHTGQLWKCEQ